MRGASLLRSGEAAAGSGGGARRRTLLPLAYPLAGRLASLNSVMVMALGVFYS